MKGMGVAESSRKVLVVEPDNLTRREIRVACEQDGYLVVEADAGSEALRQVESSRPNVVLLEVTLPDAAGFDVCRELRKMDPGVPVIMMSTRSRSHSSASAVIWIRAPYSRPANRLR